MERESMEFDVVVVGGGPSGLSAACRLMQLAQADGRELSVCLVEKGSEIGAHILSGAVFETRALEELFPNYKELSAPLNNPVTEDDFRYLINAKLAIRIPSFLLPKAMKNHGNHATSLGNICRWLAQQAENLGVNIFPGFAASEVLYDEEGRVVGVATGDMGIAATGEKKPNYEPGFELRATHTVFAEGVRGHLGKQLMERFNLRGEAATQHYAIGFKELWDIQPENHELGKVVHTVGWPGSHLGGMFTGSYLYHLENHQVSLGLIVDLSYKNPHISPFEEFQKWKHHPLIANTISKGKRVSYGARAIVKGGLPALPKLTFPGGVLVGDNAGFLNMTKVKGSHTAMKSGLLAAESIYESIKNEVESLSYQEKFEQSWLYEELYKARNSQPAIHKFGALLGSIFIWIDQITGGKLPTTLKDPIPDHATLETASQSPKIIYKKPDGVISFDRLSSVFLSNTNHEEDQPCHLQLKDAAIPLGRNLEMFDEPAQRYCPAGVYEIIEENEELRFQINAQNCVHCKTCDIKDPSQNINWVTPEGTGGPNYPNM